MRGRATRSAFALSSAALVVLGIASCSQSKPTEDSSQSNLKIVEQIQIDQNGAEVEPPAGVTPLNPAGNGKATCPPLSLAMAGALTGPDAALGINIKNGVAAGHQPAQRRQPRLPGAVEDVRHRG